MASNVSLPVLVSAPAKTILVGEHVVVHGRTAIACAVSLRTYVLVEHNAAAEVRLRLPQQGGVDVVWPLSSLALDVAQLDASALSSPADAAKPSVTFSAATLAHIERLLAPHSAALGVFNMAATTFLALLLHASRGAPSALCVTVRSTVPLGVGLGSSAAYNTAVALALLHVHGRLSLPSSAPSAAHAWLDAHSLAAERVMHGTPSGIDNATSLHGGLLAFTAGQITPLTPPPSQPRVLRVLVTNTRVSRNTKALVGAVRALVASEPVVAVPLLDSVHGIAQRVQQLWASADTAQTALEEQLATLMRVNHSVLCALGVGHEALDRVVALTRRCGFVTKLTGAGGGGCAITLVPAHADEQRVAEARDALAKEGFECLDVTLGEPGARVHVGETTMPDRSDWRFT